jgi:HlyD family secretion protein
MNAEQLKNLQIDPGAKRRPQGTLWTIFIVVAGIGAVAAYLAWPHNGEEKRVLKNGSLSSSSATPVSVASAASGAGGLPSGSVVATNARAVPASASDSVLTVSGYIINRERIEISPRFLGMVKWIGVKKGDAVTNGQVVVLLDDAEQKARVLEAEARLASTQVAVSKADLDFKRITELARTDIESRKALDDARLQLDSSKALRAEAEGTLQLVRTYLEWTVIRSPIDGVVLEKLVSPSELVMPQSFGGPRGPSTALIAVADPKDLQVEIDLSEADLAKVRLDQKCRVSPEAYPDHTYEGIVVEVAPEANRQKGTLQIKVQVRNPDRYLTPELSARVDFLK